MSSGETRKQTTALGKDQARDTGMALVLVALLYLAAQGTRGWVIPVVLLVLTMTVPSVFQYPARLWFGLSNALGAVMTKVLLALLYGLVLLPVSLCMRVLGKDAMALGAWKKGTDSAFVTRSGTFTAADLERPY